MNSLRDKTATAIAKILSPFVLVGALLTIVAFRFEDRPALLVGGLLFFLVLAPQASSLWIAYTKRTTDKYIVRR